MPVGSKPEFILQLYYTWILKYNIGYEDGGDQKRWRKAMGMREHHNQD